jgi:hypothetical protein
LPDFADGKDFPAFLERKAGQIKGRLEKPV